MSQELAQLLHERSRVGVMRLPLGLALSLGFHVLVIAAILYVPKPSAHPEETKVTWVTLPGSADRGPLGGAAPTEEGKEGERLRRVEDVAPTSSEKGGAYTPNTFGEKHTNTAKGTNTDATSLGKAPVGAKGKTPVAAIKRGAAGNAIGGGIGAGSSIPELRPTPGVQGGMGLIDLDTPISLWWVRNSQNRIMENWWRTSVAPGRVQIYFVVQRDGKILNARVEIKSYDDPSLDLSALNAVKRSTPLPPLPPEVEGPTLGVRIWMINP